MPSYQDILDAHDQLLQRIEIARKPFEDAGDRLADALLRRNNFPRSEFSYASPHPSRNDVFMGGKAIDFSPKYGCLAFLVLIERTWEGSRTSLVAVVAVRFKRVDTSIVASFDLKGDEFMPLDTAEHADVFADGIVSRIIEDLKAFDPAVSDREWPTRVWEGILDYD